MSLLLLLAFYCVACSKDSLNKTSAPTTSNTTDTTAIDTMTTNTNHNYLTVYYSWSGNSRSLATDIHNLVGGDLIEVRPTVAYTTDYNEMLDVAPREIRTIDNNGIYPSITTSVDSISSYDIIFICTPLWWSRMSTPMQSFLHSHSSRLAGNRIALVVTSQSSGISGVVNDAIRLCPNSTFVGNALWITSSQGGSSHNRIVTWLGTLVSSQIDIDV
jgi:flavodoxin